MSEGEEPGGAIYAPPKPAHSAPNGWTLWLGLTAILAWLLVAASLIFAAKRQDAAARLAQEHVLRYAIDQLRQGLVREVRDYAWWTDAWQAVTSGPDREWFASQFGRYAHEDLGLDLVFVFDRDLQTIVAESDGKPSQQGVAERLPDLAAQLAQTGGSAETGPKVASAFLRDAEGHPFVVAVSPILPEDPNIPLSQAQHFLLFGIRLERWLATTLAPTVDLPGLRWSPDPPTAEPALALHDALGRPTGWLTFTPAAPSDLLRLLTLPFVLLAGALFIVFALATAAAVRRALAAAALSQERFLEMATAMSDWLFETDTDGRLTYVSQEFSRWCPGRDPVARGEHLLELLEPVSERASEDLRSWLARRMPFRDVVARVRTDEGERRVRLAARPWYDRRRQFRGYHGAVSDVTESFRARAEAEYHARHEPFTGLANRKLLAERLDKLAARAAEGVRAAIFYIDLDGFKRINDGFGHDCGDAVLLACAERLRTCVRARDLVARVGGDEFVLVVEDLDREAAARLAERILRRLAEPVEAFGQRLEVGCSVGYALLPEDGDDPAELVRLADRALLAAKRSGRGRALPARAQDCATATSERAMRTPRAGPSAAFDAAPPPPEGPGPSVSAGA